MGMMDGLKRSFPVSLFKSQSGRNRRFPGPDSPDPLEDTSIIGIVNDFIQKAISEGASDIHIEPGEEELRIRLRIDGLLHEFPPPPRESQPFIISRLKVLAGMDISEKRLPQDGRMNQPLAGAPVNIRLSTLPTIKGEKMVLRLLNRERIIMDLDRLGLNRENLTHFKQFINSNHGIILVTGPTGCGKSTTLYSAINHLNSTEKNIITVEDPVEYHLEGINQVQINPKIGLTFGNALRNILRQDPNVIMIGEIRDTETARIATRAALTGHLVLSTLHTNDAPRAITRLLDMGVKDFLLASSLVGVVAQRLVRLLCPSCREPCKASPVERELLEKSISPGPTPCLLYRGRGCPRCSNTGYRGRIALHEILPFSDAMRELVLKGSVAGELEALARREGLGSLQQDGFQKAARGLTTIPEVIRATMNAVQSPGTGKEGAQCIPS